MRTTRHSKDELNKIALAHANADQLKTLAQLMTNGFNVTQVLHQGSRVAINAVGKTAYGWITPDGKFHRPLQGKTRVAVNPQTLERVW